MRLYILQIFETHVKEEPSERMKYNANLNIGGELEKGTCNVFGANFRLILIMTQLLFFFIFFIGKKLSVLYNFI